MARKLLNLNKSELFSLILIIILQFVAIACANMLIPSYANMIAFYGVEESLAGIPDAVFVFTSAAFAVIWGYFTDRIDRTRVVMVGAFLGTIGTTLTAFNAFPGMTGFMVLVLSRAITGAGLGSIIPVVYSVLADIIPADERSSYFGTLAILSSLSNGIGQGMSAFLGQNINVLGLGWRFPFFIISIFSIALIFLLFFIRLPSLGSHEKQLESLKDLELDYIYQLDTKGIGQIMKKKTNLVMFIQGFLCIIPGTLVVYFITTLFSDKTYGLFKVLPIEIQGPVSTVMAGLVGIGYIFGNFALARLGDFLFRKNKRNKVLLGAISLFIAVPASIAFILSAVPVDESINVLLGDSPGLFDSLVIIFQNYPSYIGYFLFALVGSFFSAAPVANRSAIMVDVNLPEHRGTTVSFFNLSEQLGKGMTLLISWPLLTFFVVFTPNISPYAGMIVFAIIFWLPAGILWLYASRKIERDIYEKSMTLTERSQLSFIDYIFDLEIKLDGGILLVHDAKRQLGKENSSSIKSFNQAIKTFETVESYARRREISDLSDIANSAHNLGLKAIMLKTELKDIMKREKNGILEPDNAEINQLRYKIDVWWERSDLGKIEVLYDSGYLKVVEARLLRKYNWIKTLRGLREGIEIFERVEMLAKERLVDEGVKKLTDEEKDFQSRAQDIRDKAIKTKHNTIYLRERLEELVNTLKGEGITLEELDKATSLSAEYKIPLLEILVESVDKKKTRKSLEKISSEIDELFDTYDEQLE